MVTSFKRSHATLTTPNPAAGHHEPTSPLETYGHSQASKGQFPTVFLLPSSGSWGTRFCLCPPRVFFPVLFKFWQLYVGFKGNLLQEGLCHTQICCTQSPCPCGSPPLTLFSTGDTQTQFCLSLCGIPGPWRTQGLFEPSQCLWWEWGLIRIVNSPPPTILLGLLLCPWMSGISSLSLQHLPSYWGFSDLGHGVYPQGQSSETQPLLLTLDVG